MQQNDEHIEQQLWQYIDGACTAAERQDIAALIQTNAAWAQKYTELQAFQAELVAANELHEPHMRFTQNVMDAIAGTQPLPVMRRYINRTLLRGIAAFFIISIGVLLLAMLFSTNWSAPTQILTQIPPVRIPSVDISGAFSSKTIMIAIGMIVMLSLALLDHILRNRLSKQH